MESATVPKTSHRVVGRLTHVAFLRVPSPFLNPDKVANYLSAYPSYRKRELTVEGYPVALRRVGQ